MKNQYYEIKNALELSRCKNCGGRGKLDDAEPGDTNFNEWTCIGCNGTGLSERRFLSRAFFYYRKEEETE